MSVCLNSKLEERSISGNIVEQRNFYQMDVIEKLYESLFLSL